ncbi:hypothetical protein TNCV_4711721 [Trichonephila clavipes]|nr:hypothetical protein TNCV_4711721 [Trichonephila clavipes]
MHEKRGVLNRRWFVGLSQKIIQASAPQPTRRRCFGMCAVNQLQYIKIIPCPKSNLGCNTRKEKSVRRVIAHQTEEERASANEQSRQRMAQIRVVEAAEQLDLRMHVLQHQMNSVLNKENTIGYKWLKDVNKKQHISLIIALHSGTTQLRIIV